MNELHLICNAHIDPVWLWDLEEGVSAALSTFRMAASFCEEYEGFVFNHNEVLLYEWIEELEPSLFRRIQKLVEDGKWHIMGGWYLQPDCNMPSGESFIRQMEAGREYFREKFGRVPTTAVNFDPFGHSQGLVQLMVKAGYDSYLFCRPGQSDCPLPDEDFIWVGLDGSQIMAHRADSYGTLMGEAAKKAALQAEKGLPSGCVLWGVGNHGGGPSRIDLDALKRMMETPGGEMNIRHSVPEAYFTDRLRPAKACGREEPRVMRDLNPWAVGCYTSQIRIKQKHRELEGELSAAEKMLTQAAVRGLMEYPVTELKEAEKALFLSEFHDVLPGTSLQSVEDRSIRLLEYGLETVGRWKRKAFFLLLSGEEKAGEGEYPILIYNPHPFEVEDVFVCEFQLANQNWGENYAFPEIYQNGEKLNSQVEKEECNLNLDWRKKVAFHAVLKPSSMNRFHARIRFLTPKERKQTAAQAPENPFCFKNSRMEAVVNPRTGLLDSYKTDGVEYLKKPACALAVMKSDCDPWGMNRHSYREESGRFLLMDEQEGSRYSGVSNERHGSAGKMIPSVRVVEDGAVRRVVEAVFSYGHSQACLRYVFPKEGVRIGLEVRVNWAEKGSFLKLEIPSALTGGVPISETAYGAVRQQADGEEKVFHRWCGFFDDKENRALTVINRGNYGVDFEQGCMRISLLHSAAYSAHPIGDRPLLKQDRFIPYMDQGERCYSFQLEGGRDDQRRKAVTRDAVLYQEPPMTVQAFPSGEGEKTAPVIRLEGEGVVLAAFRKSRRGNGYLVRLFESVGAGRKAKLEFPAYEISREIELTAFEVKTLLLDDTRGTLKECGIFGED